MDMEYLHERAGSGLGGNDRLWQLEQSTKRKGKVSFACNADGDDVDKYASTRLFCRAGPECVRNAKSASRLADEEHQSELCNSLR
jgi:hypothetical protein